MLLGVVAVEYVDVFAFVGVEDCGGWCCECG